MIFTCSATRWVSSWLLSALWFYVAPSSCSWYILHLPEINQQMFTESLLWSHYCVSHDQHGGELIIRMLGFAWPTWAKLSESHQTLGLWRPGRNLDQPSGPGLWDCHCQLPWVFVLVKSTQDLKGQSVRDRVHAVQVNDIFHSLGKKPEIRSGKMWSPVRSRVNRGRGLYVQ